MTNIHAINQGLRRHIASLLCLGPHRLGRTEWRAIVHHLDTLADNYCRLKNDALSDQYRHWAAQIEKRL